jgi:hypothetical protein
MKRPAFLLAGFSILAAIFLVYAVLYLWLADRSASRARHAGEFFHYRFFSADWEARVFLLAAFVEASAIHVWPRPFLPHPSWETLPQKLILQGLSYVRTM